MESKVSILQANAQLPQKGECCFTAAHYDTDFVICSSLVIFKAAFYSLILFVKVR